MNEKVKIGIIGVGQIGKVHITRYQDVPEAEIVAVADIRQDEATHGEHARAEGVLAQHHGAGSQCGDEGAQEQGRVEP